MRLALLCVVLLAVSACSSTSAPPPSQLTLAVPLQVDTEQEILLLRVSQLLDSDTLTDEQRAELFYQRGMLYDRIGLKGLARLDFLRALKLRPEFAQAYNMLGVYLTTQGDYTGAYEAFDATLELSPDYSWAYLNRGIALYYGDRYSLALADMQTFYQLGPEDPYRSLWLYFIEAQIDVNMAREGLEQRVQQHADDNWAWQISQVVLNKKPEDALFADIQADEPDNALLAERLCEAYFYLGKWHQLAGQQAVANNYFKLALANNIYDFIEHRYALLELERALL